MSALPAASAWAASSDLFLAQEPVGEEEEAGQEGADKGGQGQKDPEAESGAGEGETEEGAPQEEGPPWTYQMAWITALMVLFLALGIGLLYYRMIASRQRGTT